MKFKIALFLFVIFSVIEIQAQPQCNEPFNPFYICQSNFQFSEYLFFGEIVSIEKLEPGISVNYTGAYYKAEIKIKKSFNGRLPRTITLYLGADLYCLNLPIKSSYLFHATKGKLNNGNKSLHNQKAYFTQYISRPMTDYSTKAVKEVFANIESVLSDEKKNFVEGAIFERLSKVRKVSLEDEEADRSSIDIQNHQPLAHILIEATNEKDGKLYQARSGADGKFRINKIPNGLYKIKIYLPSGKQQIEPFDYRADNTLCSRKWNIYVQSKT